MHNICTSAFLAYNLLRIDLYVTKKYSAYTVFSNLMFLLKAIIFLHDKNAHTKAILINFI